MMEADKLVSKKDVAEMYSVSVRTVERMMKFGTLKRVLIRSCVRFKLSEVKRVMEGQAL